MLTPELQKLWQPIKAWPKLVGSSFAAEVDRRSRHQITAPPLPKPLDVAPIELLLALGEATREGVRATADPLLDPLARWWPVLRFLGYFDNYRGRLALSDAAAAGITRRSKATVTEALGIAMSIHLARSLGASGLVVDVDAPGKVKIRTSGSRRPDYVFVDGRSITHVIESKGFTATGSSKAIATAVDAADQVMSVVAPGPLRLVVGQQLDGRRIVPLCCLVAPIGARPPVPSHTPHYAQALLRTVRWAGVQGARGRFGEQLDVLEVIDPVRQFSSYVPDQDFPATLRGTTLTIGSRVPYSIFFGLADEVFRPLEEAVPRGEPESTLTDERARDAIEEATSAAARDQRRRRYERRHDHLGIEPLLARSPSDNREFALMISDAGYALGFSV